MSPTSSWKCGLVLLLVVGVALAAGGRKVASMDAAKRASAPAPVQMAAVHKFDDAEVQKSDWGWLRWLMNAKVEPGAPMTLGLVYIEPNHSNPFHIHPNSDEYVHVLEGSCQQRVGDRWMTMKSGDTVRIPRNVRHMARTGKEPCRAIIVYDTGNREMVPVTDSDATK